MIIKDNIIVKFQSSGTPVYKFISVKPEHAFKTLKEVGKELNNALENESALKFFMEKGEVILLTKDDKLIGNTYCENGKYTFLRGKKNEPLPELDVLQTFYDFLKAEGRSEYFLSASIEYHKPTTTIAVNAQAIFKKNTK